VCGKARGGQQERVAAEDTRSRFGDGVEGGERLLGVQEVPCYARPAAAEAGLAVEEVRLERPKMSIQMEVVVQRMSVQGSGGVVVVVPEEQTSIALGPRPHRRLVPSSSDTSDTSTT
jgi:hypothetical protein